MVFTKGWKRKASSSGLDTPAKKVRIGNATDIPDPTITSSAGRPKRTTVSEPKYNFTRRRLSSTQSANPAVKEPQPASKRRGRPPKAVAAAAAADEIEDDVKPRGRGRPPKTIASPARAPTKEEKVAPKKRGRPSKTATTPPSKAASVSAKTARAATSKKAPAKASTTAPAKRGRKPKAAAEVAEPVLESETDAENPLILNGDADANVDGDADKMEDLAGIDPDVQYWLMKAEPNSRIENGHDVKFSIDDLAAKTEPEAWDGVRNVVARNNLRAMRKGDLGFFYHSNCTVPGIAGVLRIVDEHTPDESAFDPEHPYFDSKSDRTNPKWEVVHVEFVKKFDNLITLRELKSFAKPGGALENMQTLKQSRLSVSSVSPAEWRFILDHAGEPITLGHADVMGGYESEVDGEGEETAGVSDGEGINGFSDDGVGLGIADETPLEGPAAMGSLDSTSYETAKGEGNL
ncbi:hypothetical protein H2200_010508 [Cladophialophora chaetospira]|uniref:Thymocyte nuclear protein 1 n=1 Tax=Cladophialophora chaetospira TaxID=386627 RepID=A0AA38X1K4_9EURO|nr:hypothetical protein H2200_010508 [Cladophialophora chaetospira]